MVVSDLGGSVVVSEATVTATHWMEALQSGRAALGETGGVPPGASCAVAPTGVVTVLDPRARRRIVLAPEPPASNAPTAARPSAPPPVADAAKRSSAPPPRKRKKRVGAQTMAYIPARELPPLPPAQGAPRGPAPGPARSAPPSAAPAATQGKKRRVGSQTIAYVPKGDLPPLPDPVRPPPGRDVAPPSPVTPPVPPSAPPSVPPPVSPSVPPQKRRAKHQTMAYIPQQPAAPSSKPAPPKRRAKSKTMAYIPAGDLPTSPGETPAASARSGGFAPAGTGDTPPPPSSPAEADAPVAVPAEATTGVLDDVAWTLVGSRDADPDADNPLLYRERSYAVPPGTPPLHAEALARDRAAAYVTALAARPPGKFINVAVFDHAWTERPLRPPLVTAQMKDWVGELKVERTEAPPEPAAPELLSPSSRPDPRPQRTTNEQDQRLAGAFEACQDLFFLEAPRDALEFASRLFADLLPTERFSASLYDIDADVLHVVSARGPDAETRRGRAFRLAGLLGEAARTGGAALRIEHAGSDPRYDV
ncbi:MAG: hypothetical protein AAF447_22200, partial [Myxococcota bacterium]